MKKTKNKIIHKITFLREKGYSIPEISKELKVPKTTVFRYAKDIKIDPNFTTFWMGKRGGSKKRKLLKEKKAEAEAKEIVQNITEREKLLFLSALYWAEGSKTDFILTNTDPNLIFIFIEALHELFGLTNNQIRISIRIFEDLDKEKCLQFWSEVTGIPKESFLSVHVLPGKKIGKLQHGMCRVRVVKGGDLLKKITAINKAFVGSFEKQSVQ